MTAARMALVATIFWSTTRSTVAVLAINLIWLLPLALLVGMGYLDGLPGFLLASGPLIFLVIKYDAGKQE